MIHRVVAYRRVTPGTNGPGSCCVPAGGAAGAGTMTPGAPGIGAVFVTGTPPITAGIAPVTTGRGLAAAVS